VSPRRTSAPVSAATPSCPRSSTPAIQEAQLALAASLEQENRIAVAQAKAYFGNQRKSFFVTGAGKDNGPVDYVPNQVFETDVNVVSYPLAGSM
jgi:hypothetical protein